jgi:hypothetical protein
MAAADSLGNRTEQNRTSRKEGKKRKKKERETVKRKENQREREGEKESCTREKLRCASIQSCVMHSKPIV